MKLLKNREYFKDKKVLMTGASGFIGSNLLRYFISNRIKVSIIVKKSSNLWRIPKCDMVETYYADLEDYNETINVLKHSKANIIFHLASSGGHPSSFESFQNFFTSNFKITSNLLEASVKYGIEKFIYSGSSLEGEVIHNKVFENYSLKPFTLRGITKASETLMCSYYAENYNLNLINNRLFYVYGPWEQPSRLIPQLIMKFLRKQSISLSAQDFKRDFVFIDDVIHCMVLSCCKENINPGTIINIGSGTLFSSHDIYDSLTQIFGYELLIDPKLYPSQVIHNTPCSADLKVVSELLGWQPENSITEGLMKTVNWFRKNHSLYE